MTEATPFRKASRASASRRTKSAPSFRCAASVSDACFTIVDNARAVVELNLSTSDDNPAILPDQICSLPNANFDPIHLVIAFETLGLARVTACWARAS